MHSLTLLHPRTSCFPSTESSADRIRFPSTGMPGETQANAVLAALRGSSALQPHRCSAQPDMEQSVCMTPPAFHDALSTCQNLIYRITAIIHTSFVFTASSAIWSTKKQTSTCKYNVQLFQKASIHPKPVFTPELKIHQKSRVGTRT